MGSGHILTNGYSGQENDSTKHLVRNSFSLPIIDDCETERLARISSIDTKTRHTSITFGSTDDDVEVIRIKSKGVKSKKKSSKKKQSYIDPEKISVASTNSNNSAVSIVISSSVTTPESGYRSNLECLSPRNSGDRFDCSSDNVMVSSTGTDASSNLDNGQCSADGLNTYPNYKLDQEPFVASTSPKDALAHLHGTPSHNLLRDTKTTSDQVNTNNSCHKLEHEQFEGKAVTFPDIYSFADLEQAQDLDADSTTRNEREDVNNRSVMDVPLAKICQMPKTTLNDDCLSIAKAITLSKKASTGTWCPNNNQGLENTVESRTVDNVDKINKQPPKVKDECEVVSSADSTKMRNNSEIR